MANSRKSPGRRLLRDCQRHRLEDQLLVLAYEQVRPLIRKRQRASAGQRSQQPCDNIRNPKARSA
jgi:hypothetical protein